MSSKDININISNWLKGKDEEFPLIYSHYKPKVYRYAIRYLKDKNAAEDLAATAMIRVWENRHRIEASRFENYLFTIARNDLITRWRQSLTRSLPILFAEQIPANAASHSTHKQLEESYYSALNELPTERKRIFIMHREQRLTYREIAEKLDISPKTVENQISSTLKQLRVRLAHLLYHLF